MNRDISHIERINDLNFLDFLKAIGIKQVNIKNFDRNVNWDNDKNNLVNFRLYLKYYDTVDEPNNRNSLNDEIEAFRQFGFISRYAKYYVNTIQHIYNNDITVNWIFRIIESFMSETSLDNFCNFVYKCHKNLENETAIDEENNKNSNNYFDDSNVITILG